MIGVVVKPNEPFERALKRFTKSCEKNGIISDVKKRQRYEKPSEEKSASKRLPVASVSRKSPTQTASVFTNSIFFRNAKGKCCNFPFWCLYI